MAKNKPKSRRKEAKQATTSKPIREGQPLVADPPRRNLPLLVISSGLLAIWLIYLLIVAVWG
jgi:hypothetical protein